MSSITIEQAVTILSKEYGFKKSEALKKLQKSDKPKRAATGYNLFVADERPRIKTANPDDSTQDLMRKVGAAWKALEDEERQEWNSEALAAKSPDLSDAEMEAAPASPKAKKAKKAKRAPTGYNLFVAAQRSKIAGANPDDSTQNIMKKVGAAWKALDEEDREEWNEEAKRALD